MKRNQLFIKYFSGENMIFNLILGAFTLIITIIAIGVTCGAKIGQ